MRPLERSLTSGLLDGSCCGGLDTCWGSAMPLEAEDCHRRDRSVVLALNQGLRAALNIDEKRAHLANIGREHLIDDICIQEYLPPES